MQTTARLLAEYLDVDRCAYATVEDQRVFDITGDWSRGVPSIVGRWDVAAFGDACVAHMLENTPFIVDDTDDDSRIPPDVIVAYRAATIRAVICVPLHKQGVFTAAMAVHQKVPRRWTSTEIELVTLVVQRCWETLERTAVTRTQIEGEHALAESRARLEYAVRLSGFGFWYCDLPFDELLWDERVREHFFLSRDARVTIDLFYERIHPEDRERTRNAIDAAIANHSTYDVIYRTVCSTTGDVKFVRALGGAVYAKDGSPQRFDGVTLDVTALHEHARRKDEFLATLAHELRNPLAPIRTGIELLRSSPDGAQRARTLETMERQIVHLVRMVDDLLDISRVTLGKITLVKARTDFRAVLDSAIETVRGALDANGLVLVVDVVPGELPLDVDPTRIAQVIANLLSNAGKYTPHGGRINVAADRIRDEAWLRIRVSDTGVGIPSDKLTAIFEMFTQLGQSIDRAQGGLGIGLTLARRLVELHDGSITAESAGPDNGATFTVCLQLSNRVDVPVLPASAAATGHLRILLVDDNVDAAEILGMLLEALGHEIHIVHTGPAAVEGVSRLQPDVVLLDIGLPGFDGYEVARRVRADMTRQQPMLVALTGWGAESDRRMAKEAGFDEHLVKPIEITRLTSVLATCRP